jgi:hypothetical protein
VIGRRGFTGRQPVSSISQLHASTKAWRIEPIVHPLSWPGSGRQFNSTLGGWVSRESSSSLPGPSNNNEITRFPRFNPAVHFALSSGLLRSVCGAVFLPTREPVETLLSQVRR